MPYSNLPWNPFDGTVYYYIRSLPPDPNLYDHECNYDYVDTPQYLLRPPHRGNNTSFDPSYHKITKRDPEGGAAAPNPNQMEPLTPEEMELFQRLSNEYQPNIVGPLISTKQTTRVIEAEYANADPILAAKTRALAATHPFVRLIKGDGNCAWRAISFGYFESLFRSRSVDLVKREYGRFRDMATTLTEMGHEEYLYEPFLDSTLNILAEIVQGIQRGEPDETFLLDAINAPYVSDSIVAFFRLLTSCHIQTNAVRYQHLLDIPLADYCRTRIEPTNPEIDEIGLQALLNGIIDGSGFSVEVLYLDRSQGTEVTSHVLLNSDPTFKTIRLLYRPGHYDLIYQARDDDSVHPFILLQYGMSIYSPWAQSGDPFDASAFLMGVPQLMDEEYCDGETNTAANTHQSNSAVSSDYTSTPMLMMSPIDPTGSAGPMSPQAVTNSSPSPLSPLPPPAIPATGSPAPARDKSTPEHPPGEAQIRLNPWVMKQTLTHVPVTTPFKNSPYNQAHFMNDRFEPIHWEPTEYKK